VAALAVPNEVQSHRDSHPKGSIGTAPKAGGAATLPVCKLCSVGPGSRRLNVCERRHEEARQSQVRVHFHSAARTEKMSKGWFVPWFVPSFFFLMRKHESRHLCTTSVLSARSESLGVHGERWGTAGGGWVCTRQASLGV